MEGRVVRALVFVCNSCTGDAVFQSESPVPLPSPPPLPWVLGLNTCNHHAQQKKPFLKIHYLLNTSKYFGCEYVYVLGCNRKMFDAVGCSRRVRSCCWGELVSGQLYRACCGDAGQLICWHWGSIPGLSQALNSRLGTLLPLWVLGLTHSCWGVGEGSQVRLHWTFRWGQSLLTESLLAPVNLRLQSCLPDTFKSTTLRKRSPWVCFMKQFT